MATLLGIFRLLPFQTIIVNICLFMCNYLFISFKHSIFFSIAKLTCFFVSFLYYFPLLLSFTTALKLWKTVVFTAFLTCKCVTTCFNCCICSTSYSTRAKQNAIATLIMSGCALPILSPPKFEKGVFAVKPVDQRCSRRFRAFPLWVVPSRVPV